MSTIYALSSGQPPAGIAVVRVSGSKARAVLLELTGTVPAARRASFAAVRHDGELLDHAVILFFPGPGTVTGEDVAELHLHGGRAVVDGVLQVLGCLTDLRLAEPGEFTRRALENGRLDLTEAEGLADLLEAETATQRRAALLLSGGALGRATAEWNTRLLALAAAVEALLDFSDEGDVDQWLSPAWEQERSALVEDLRKWLARAPAERLKDGVRVVIAGPPNAGKSTLLNALVGRSAAITSATPGTTRDLIEVPVAIDGVPFILIDSAGLRSSKDPVEAVGVERASAAILSADIVLWLGRAGQAPDHTHLIQVHAKSDQSVSPIMDGVSVSAETGCGMSALTRILVSTAKTLLPAEGEVALSRRHRSALAITLEALEHNAHAHDLLIVAENMRLAMRSLDELTGRASVEHMLDGIFSRFCIGK